MNIFQIYVYVSFPFDFEGWMWDLIVSIPDHCLSIYFAYQLTLTLKVPITTAADDIHKYSLIVLQRKEDLLFHVNSLLCRGFI